MEGERVKAIAKGIGVEGIDAAEQIVAQQIARHEAAVIQVRAEVDRAAGSLARHDDALKAIELERLDGELFAAAEAIDTGIVELVRLFEVHREVRAQIGRVCPELRRHLEYLHMHRLPGRGAAVRHGLNRHIPCDHVTSAQTFVGYHSGDVLAKARQLRGDDEERRAA